MYMRKFVHQRGCRDLCQDLRIGHSAYIFGDVARQSQNAQIEAKETKWLAMALCLADMVRGLI